MVEVMTSKKIRYVVNLDDDVATEMDQIVEDLGLTRNALVQKIFLWWLDQSDVIRAETLEILPQSIRADVSRVILEKMANEPQEDDNAPEPLQLPKTQPPLRSAARKKSKRK